MTPQRSAAGAALTSARAITITRFRIMIRSFAWFQLIPEHSAAVGMRISGKGDLDHAIQDFDQAIRLSPTDAAAFYARGNVYARKSDYDHAIQDYDRAVQLNPTDTAQLSQSRHRLITAKVTTITQFKIWIKSFSVNSNRRTSFTFAAARTSASATTITRFKTSINRFV